MVNYNLKEKIGGEYMRRVIVLMVAVLLVIVGMVAYQLSSRGEGTCAHDYYLADYVPATEEENGYREYTSHPLWNILPPIPTVGTQDH